jgi:transcriptional regulator with XRE-family HTH domain
MAEIVGERLERLIDERRLSQSALARMLGISQPSIGRLISGETRESGKLLELARALRTSPEYLVGEVDDPDLVGSLIAFHAEPATDADIVQLSEFNVAYGLGGSFIHDEPARQVLRTFSRSWVRQFTSAPMEQIFWATSSGTSMMPAILDSDILLIDTTQQSPRMWDQFWAIEMHGLGMIKSLRPAKDGGMRLVSVNPDFRDELAYDGEMTVIGRVVAIVRKV